MWLKIPRYSAIHCGGNQLLNPSAQLAPALPLAATLPCRWKPELWNQFLFVHSFFSETERYCVFEAIHKFLTDYQSEIIGGQLLHHHWELPHNECVGPDCKFCLRVSFQVQRTATLSRISRTWPNIGNFSMRLKTEISLWSLDQIDREHEFALTLGQQKRIHYGTLVVNHWHLVVKIQMRWSKPRKEVFTSLIETFML